MTLLRSLPKITFLDPKLQTAQDILPQALSAPGLTDLGVQAGTTNVIMNLTKFKKALSEANITSNPTIGTPIAKAEYCACTCITFQVRNYFKPSPFSQGIRMREVCRIL